MPQNHQKRLKCRKTANICGKNEIVKDKEKKSWVCSCLSDLKCCSSIMSSILDKYRKGINVVRERNPLCVVTERSEPTEGPQKSPCGDKRCQTANCKLRWLTESGMSSD